MSYYKTIYQHYTTSYNHFPQASNLLISAGFTNDCTSNVLLNCYFLSIL